MSICARFTVNWNGKRWKFDNAAPLPSPLPSPPKWDAVYICNKYDGLPGWILSLKKKGIVQYFVSIVYSTDKLLTLWMGSSRLKCNLFSNYDATNEKGEKIRLKYEDINCDTRAKNESKILNKFSSQDFISEKKENYKKFWRNI